MIWMLGKITKKTRLNKINKEFTQQIGRIATQIAKGKRNEEETRRWCVDLVRSAMGYKDSDIETELKILGQRVDIAIKDRDKVIMVIECKAATFNLNNAAVNQAANYATSLGAEWFVVTNGHNWQLYHVETNSGSEPDVVQVFDVYILDEDGLSQEDAGNLYLLTKDAIKSGETMLAFHQGNCVSDFDSLRLAISSPSILGQIARKMESEYKSKTGVSVTVSDDEVHEFLHQIIDAVEPG